MASLWRQHRGFLLFIGLMMVFRSAVADWNYVPSSSMNPTLVQGDRVLVNKAAYSLRVPFSLVHLTRWGAPERGDVITTIRAEVSEVFERRRKRGMSLAQLLSANVECQAGVLHCL